MSFIRMAAAGLALCASASVASAQSTAEKTGHEGHAGMQGQKRHAKLFEGITLTAEQQQKIDELRARHHADRGKSTASATPDGRAEGTARANRSGMMQKHYSEIRAVLNADQQAVFDRNVEEMKKKRQSIRSKQTRT